MSAAVAAVPRRSHVVRWAIVASVGSFLALALVAGLLLTGDDTPRLATGSGRMAPAFSLPDVNDSSLNVTLATGKPTVLYFFASWCVPCRKELPIVEAASRSRDDVAFVGVNHLDHRDDARDFMEKYGSTLPAGHDPSGKVLLEYGLRGLPATVFIDADGRIETALHGELDRETLEKHIDELVLQGSPD